MKIHKISIVGAILSVFGAILVTQRWWFKWYDPSQFVLGIGICVIGLIFSYIYNWMKNLDSKIDNFDKRLDNLSRYFMKEEFE